MEYINIIGIVLGLLFLTALIIVQINRMCATKKMKAEREKCFSMISRYSQLLRLWEVNVYITDVDFIFLKHRIYKNYIRIHEMPLELVSSERERLILAEGFHWTSASKEDRYVKYHGEMNRENAPCPYGIVLDMAVAGFSKRENPLMDLEWIYYMWLTEMFIQATGSQKSTDWEDLKRLCFKVEKWADNYNMDSQYLKDKIKECREQFDNHIKESIFSSITQPTNYH